MRRRHHEEHINHEAWAIPYGDLLTLLLALFVVMYAVSVVNEGKFRVASNALVQAFHGTGRLDGMAGSSHPGATPAPIPARVPPAPHRAAIPLPMPAPAAAPAAPNLERIEQQVRAALKPLIDKRLVTLRRDQENWLEIEIRNDVLFPSGVAQLSGPAQGVLHTLSGVLEGFANPLRVEGFTDDVPIANATYPSNWELSAARAGSVARLFAGSGIAQDRLSIVGWGEMRPVADNATAAGRSQNRRVLIVVMGNGAAARRAHGAAADLDRLPGVAAATPQLPTVTVDGRPAPAASAAAGVAPALPSAAVPLR